MSVAPRRAKIKKKTAGLYTKKKKKTGKKLEEKNASVNRRKGERAPGHGFPLRSAAGHFREF